MASGKSQLPTPVNYRTWQAFAADLIVYLETSNQSFENPDPQAVQLAHALTTPQPKGASQYGLVKTGMPRATVDGILMFDPQRGKPVISLGGVWRTFTLDP